MSRFVEFIGGGFAGRKGAVQSTASDGTHTVRLAGPGGDVHGVRPSEIRALAKKANVCRHGVGEEHGCITCDCE